MSPSCPPTLAAIPHEVLEHVAFFAATDNLLGPPDGLLPLLVLNRNIHSALAFDLNPHLYARIYAYKFDLAPAVRRLGADTIPASALGEELRRKCVLLKRVRKKMDSKVDLSLGRHEAKASEGYLTRILWMAYLMMLENDGRNERQLREYAKIDEWLKEFWFDPLGSSLAMGNVKADHWPDNHERISLAMWLFWLLLRPDDYMDDENMFRDATGILKLVALAAHRYPLCYPIWYEFIPKRQLKEPSIIRHYSSNISVVAPAPGAPAILSYLTLANKLSVSWETINSMKPLAPTISSSAPVRSSREWEGEWARTVGVGDSRVVLGNTLSGAFRPGSLEGVWEGLFTYTEFTAYAALLSGAPPATLQRSLVAQHRQTWKLREYHLVESPRGEEYHEHDREPSYLPTNNHNNPHPSYNQNHQSNYTNGGYTHPHPHPHSYSYSYTQAHARQPRTQPLPPGDPSRGYIPNGTIVKEGPFDIEVLEPGQHEPIVYRSFASIKKEREAESAAGAGPTGAVDSAGTTMDGRVKDVFVTGEGHSAWGQFNLVGRVRPSDGFISLSKEYVDGDRGKWLYRGYMIGDANGNLSGRWRDTLTLPHIAGYEGCFVMSRRK